MNSPATRAAADLRFLTSEAAAGRLSGTPGAAAAADYLARRLAEIGLRPSGAAGYLDPLEVPAARLTGPVRLRVGETELRHRTDYGEVAALSTGGTAAGPLRVISGPVDPAAVAGSVLLIPERPAGFDLAATAATAADLGARALLVESGEPRWFHKTVHVGKAPRLPVIRLRRSVATTLAARDGAPVQLELPLESGARPCANVVGLLPGRRTDRAVVLTAHYDHLGDDSGGQRFPGAQDNAGGVAAILAAAEQLAAGPPLPFTLAVALLTGEESGLWGARHLAAHPAVPLAAAINLDVLWEPGPGAAVRLGHPPAAAELAAPDQGDAHPGRWLPDLAAALLTRRGYQPAWVGGSDDSAAMIRAGIPTVGLGRQQGPPGQAAIHTPDDGLAAVSPEQVAEAAGLVAELVRQVAASGRI